VTGELRARQERLRRWRRVHLLALPAGFAAAFAADVALRGLGLGAYLFGLGALSFFYATYRVYTSACPRCGEAFFGEWSWFVAKLRAPPAFRDNCAHCDLSVYE
jgi:hypothetical protein